MNTITKIIIISIVVLGAGFLFVNFASAQPPADNLVVVFEPNPLFNVTNFLPGDTVTGLAKVTNNSTETQKIGTRAIRVNNDDHLGDVMYLEIKQGATSLYTGTLSDFFNAGEIYLSDLGTGNDTTYNYSITFDSSAGDEYQGKQLGFDIVIGFFGEESVGGEVITPGGTGGTGGSGYTSDTLIISNEAIVSIGPYTVTITWDTNLNATSRVIYSPSPAPSFDIDNPPNYGYTKSTIDDINKVLNHSVTINGLIPGTTYFFRCVSHASPDTLSPEYSFTTLGPGETPSEGKQQLGEQTGEVLGEAIIRTALPETGSPRSEAGGILEKFAKKEFKINLLIGAGLIFIWIVLFLIRKRIKHLT